MNSFPGKMQKYAQRSGLFGECRQVCSHSVPRPGSGRQWDRTKTDFFPPVHVRTLPPGGQCFGEGPLSPQLPGTSSKPYAKIPRPLKRSNWPGVLGEIVLLLGLCLLLLVSKAGQMLLTAMREPLSNAVEIGLLHFPSAVALS